MESRHYRRLYHSRLLSRFWLFCDGFLCNRFLCNGFLCDGFFHNRFLSNRFFCDGFLCDRLFCDRFLLFGGWRLWFLHVLKFHAFVQHDRLEM